MTTTNTTNRRNEMTYGIKYEFNGRSHLMTSMNEWMSSRFAGGVGGYKVKEWKTRKGAERAARRWTTVPAEVFTITDTLNY